MILSAESYTSELLPEVRGKGLAIVENAHAEAASRKDQAQGEVARFLSLAPAFKKEPKAIEHKLRSDFWRDLPASVTLEMVTESTEVVLPISYQGTERTNRKP